MRDFPIALSGEGLLLLGEGGLLRVRDRTLYLADLHLGKAATFRAAGIPIPFGTTDDTLARLDRLIARVAPGRLVILGDFWHARAGRHHRTGSALKHWREKYAALPMTLIRGNHDRAAGDPEEELRIDCLDAPVLDGGFVLRHHPTGDAQSETGTATGQMRHEFWLAGHVHPAVEISGFPRERLLMPCFHLTRHGMVLPAFGAFTGKGVIRPLPGERVFVLAEGEVVEVRCA